MAEKKDGGATAEQIAEMKSSHDKAVAELQQKNNQLAQDNARQREIAASAKADADAARGEDDDKSRPSETVTKDRADLRAEQEKLAQERTALDIKLAAVASGLTAEALEAALNGETSNHAIQLTAQNLALTRDLAAKSEEKGEPESKQRGPTPGGETGADMLTGISATEKLAQGFAEREEKTGSIANPVP